MGLDMFLIKKTYVYRYPTEKDDDNAPKLAITYPGVKPERVTYIEERIGIWRKANAIHQWFVDNVQDGEDDCRPYYTSIDDLKKLRDAVSRVLANRSLARELLPTQGGFFFGSLDYDQYYFDDLKLTQEICDLAINEDTDGEYYYEASW